jgi:hypothetical protein
MDYEIDLKKYADFFHDGILYSITTFNDGCNMKMSSAELVSDDIETGMKLSMKNTIVGFLHLSGIKHILIDSNHRCLGDFFKEFDEGTILDFEFSDTEIDLGIQWENYPPKPWTNKFSTIKIKADRIWWENIPNLIDPVI